MIKMVNKKLKWGGFKSRVIDISPYNISNKDLDNSKSFYREEVNAHEKY